MSDAPQAYVFETSGGVPNSTLPLLLWRARPKVQDIGGAAACALYERNGWVGTWVYTVYPFWHFHTLGHEVLCCVSGTARIGFGGEGGLEADIAPGDVCIIPAGVGHRRIAGSEDFRMAGGYPPGQRGDIVKEGAMSLDEARQAIAKVSLPTTDPVTGRDDGVVSAWTGFLPGIR